MFVGDLPLIVVFRMKLPVGTGDCLCGLVCLKAEVSRLMFECSLLIAQAVVTMDLQVLWINRKHGIEPRRSRQ